MSDESHECPNCGEGGELRHTQAQLAIGLRATLNRFIAEYNISYEDLIGVLECVKHEFLMQRMEEDDEDDDT